ncbi:MAG: S9 family peptidase [Caulobacteraceae bacterium]
MKLTLERAFANPGLSGPAARGVKLSPDGKSVTYIKAKDDDQRLTDLWICDVAGGQPRLLIDARAFITQGQDISEAEKTRRERLGVQTRGVVEYHWDDEGRFILVPLEGDLWLYDIAAGKPRRLSETPGAVDAKVSPKGTWVSFVRDENLFVIPSGGGAERALTSGGAPLRSWATPDYIAQEEMGRSTAYWWSPDETKIALTFVDESGVDIVERADIDATETTIVPQRYPRVGRPNAVVDLYVMDVASAALTKIDLGKDADIYLARVAWSKDGRLFVQRQSRDQKRLDLLTADILTGATHAVLTETSDHWVSLHDDLRFLSAGGFLWASERDGNKHLYLHGAHGDLIRQVTAGDWPVAGIAGVDEARGVVRFTASKASPLERQLYEVSYLEPGEPVALTSGEGWWNVAMARQGGAFVGTYDDDATPPRTGLYGADGTLVRWIEENRLEQGHPFHPYRDRLSPPKFGTIKAADGQDLWWVMRTPPGFDATRRYPVIVQVYGGPAGQMVDRMWAPPTDLLYLEAGFILFSIDNRGTPNRSVAFKTALHEKTGRIDVEDQLLGAKYLAGLPYVDAGRIGVTGWSNGGYLTLMLLTVPESPYAAGVAGAPMTDLALYDTHYMERYMGTKASNAAGYEAGEMTRRIAHMRPGSLLLIHGMADDNVTFDHSTRLIAALQAADIDFEMMLYPGLRHRAGWTMNHVRHRTRATIEFFARKLGAGAAS